MQDQIDALKDKAERLRGLAAKCETAAEKLQEINSLVGRLLNGEELDTVPVDASPPHMPLKKLDDRVGRIPQLEVTGRKPAKKVMPKPFVEKDKNASNVDRVRAFIEKKGPMLAREIYRALNLKPQAVYNVLNQIGRKVAKGRYAGKWCLK